MSGKGFIADEEDRRCELSNEVFDINSWYATYKGGCPSCDFNFERDGNPYLNLFPHFMGACVLEDVGSTSGHPVK